MVTVVPGAAVPPGGSWLTTTPTWSGSIAPVGSVCGRQRNPAFLMSRQASSCGSPSAEGTCPGRTASRPGGAALLWTGRLVGPVVAPVGVDDQGVRVVLVVGPDMAPAHLKVEVATVSLGDAQVPIDR